MSFRFDDSEPTISVETRLLVDRLCDQVASQLLRNEKVDWNQVFEQLSRAYWPFLIQSLIPQLKQTLDIGDSRRLEDLFQQADADIVKLVKEYTAQGFTRDSDFAATVLEQVRSGNKNEALPDQIDHFQIVKLIGQGGFGKVLLARDQHLDRDVVIKLPRERAYEAAEYLNSFIEEARKIAKLDHPGIVRIHHVGVWQLRPYLVQQYVTGGDLKQALRARQFSFRETAELVAEVSESIAYAHRLRIVHRDLKPANILLDDKGRPLVADFGLAIHESEQFGKGGMVAGTAHYMAPEQLRGEVHRLDGRTDLWSLGVCLFLMLTGELPFQGDDSATLYGQISQQPCRPPRQINPAIPKELERVCLKCLSKRMDDRYGTGIDLAADLRAWLGNASTNDLGYAGGGSMPNENGVGEVSLETAIEVQNQQVIPDLSLAPKGLIAFDQKDHKWFLKMVPGPISRHGIPEQLRFWEEKINSSDPTEAFSVGLIYGPSGCGKSSFVKAGLLPLLPPEIGIVYVEATDADTEVRLLVGLRNLFPELPRDLDLPRIFAQLRRGRWLGRYRKVLIVFDQFEQWLHVNEVSLANQLVEALRHCDGMVLQTLVLARDDFWMKVSRLFQELEIPLEDRKNFQPLYLFDVEHAKRVLIDFGKAYGRLPLTGALSSTHERFLKESVERLADNGKIICIHLVLLAETLRDRDWVPASLRDIGDLKQIGVLFLEQQFSSNRANPTHRSLLGGISRVLEYLLPVDATNIKARFRERNQIASASGFTLESKQFSMMMNVLEKQLKLISAVDPDMGIPRDGISDDGQRFYQLSHDFLVPSVRHWLAGLQTQSPAGRAKIRLQSLAAGYSASEDSRFVPTIWEFTEILRYVRLKDCSEQAQRLYKQARKVYAYRGLAIAAAVLMLVVAWNIHQQSNQLELAKARMEQWIHARPEELNFAIPLITERPKISVVTMRNKLAQDDLPDVQAMRLKLGLALNQAASDEEVRQLIEYLPACPYAELGTLRKALQLRQSVSLPALQQVYAASEDRQQQVKIAVVLFHLGDFAPLISALNHAADFTRSLLAVDAISMDQDDVSDYLQFLQDRQTDLAQHDVIAGIVKALAIRFDDSILEQERPRWVGICEKYFRDSPSGPMHAAAEFALNRLSGYANDYTAPLRGEKQLGKNWVVTMTGLTMIRMPAERFAVKAAVVESRFSLAPYEGETVSDFWVSATEVSVELFRRFQDSLAGKGLTVSQQHDDHSADLPITSIDFIQAMRFCNWLSDLEGLEHSYIESEMPLQFSDSDRQMFPESREAGGDTAPWKNLKQWTLNLDGNGYRLPGIGENYFLAYGASLPEFKSMAVAKQVLSSYAWHIDNTDPLVLQPVGRLMPNHLGAFDVLGNASELTLDTRSPNIGIEHRVTVDSYLSPVRALVDRQFRYTFLWIEGDAASIRVVRSRIDH